MVVEQPNRQDGNALYRRFIAGERDALTELVALYGEALTRHIFAIVNNDDDAEELMIDAFARLARCKKNFDSETALKAYLFTIGKNLALRYIKKHRHIVLVRDVDELLVPSSAHSAETSALRDERRRQLNAAMDRLKPEHREVLRLIYFEELSYSEAAAVMRKSAKQIDGLLYRAKISLKKVLESDGITYAED